ncbi:MAG: hypothetical protein NVSMB64_02330 [Candidatus Velthaea sp.]
MKQRSGAIGGILAVVALVVSAIAYNTLPVRGSDHQDSPTTFARPAADITDVFVYPATDPTKVVLQMDVDTSATPTADLTQLDPSVLYQFKIAHGAAGGAEDMVIQLLPQGTGASQTINVYGPFTPAATGTVSSNGPLSGSVPFNVTTGTVLTNGMNVFVGKRADPFFFDLAQFFKIIPDRNVGNQPNPPPPLVQATGFRGFTAAFNTANGTKCDTSASQDFLSANNANVVAIVIEAPRSLIAPAAGSQVIHLWATTSTRSGS